MRKKKVYVLSVCVALALFVSGCGLFDQSSSSSSSTSSSSDSSSSSISSSSISSSSSSASSSNSSSSSSSSTSSSDSSSDTSSSSSSSSPSSSSSQSAVTVNWDGNYVSEEGSASQVTLTISGTTEKQMIFEFYVKGIVYSGTATIDKNSPNIATYQDPNTASYGLTFSYSDKGITVAEKGTYPDANCSFAGNFSAQ